jgi:hypothetical protein
VLLRAQAPGSAAWGAHESVQPRARKGREYDAKSVPVYRVPEGSGGGGMSILDDLDSIDKLIEEEEELTEQQKREYYGDVKAHIAREMEVGDGSNS